MKKCILIILLISLFILSGVSAQESTRNLITSNENITPGKLYNELALALRTGNTEYFQQLIATYTELAQQLQQRLRELGRKNKIDTEEYRAILAELERALSVPIAEEDITIEHFWQEFLTAISTNDSDSIQQLMSHYPHTAQETWQWLLDLAEQGTIEEAQLSLDFASILSDCRSGKIPEVSDETKAIAGGIASGQFINEFIDAAEAQDIEHLHQLVISTPKTAEIVQQVLQNLVKEKSGEEAAYFQEVVELLAELRIGYMPHPDLDRLKNEGFSAFYIADYQKALEIWQTGLNRANALHETYYIGQFLGDIGMVYLNLGQYEQALEYFEQALATTSESRNRAGERSALTGIGDVYTALGHYKEALESYEKSLVISREIDDRDGEGASLTGIANVYENLGEYQQALTYQEQALAIWRNINNRREEMVNLSNIGNIYGQLGQYLRALEFYEQALAISREFGDRYTEGSILSNIGNIYGYWGQYLQALEYQEQALIIYRDLGNPGRQAHIIGNIGGIYSMRGQYQKALQYSRQALEIKRQLGDRKGEGHTLGNIGSLYAHIGYYQQAIEYQEQALEIGREIGDKRGEGSILTNIGELYREQGQYSLALEYYEYALSIHRSIKDKLGEEADVGNIGLVYDSIGQPQRAREYLEQALSIAREIGDRAGEGIFLSNIGDILRSSGHYQQALDYHRQALTIAREIEDQSAIGTALTNIAAVYVDLSQYSDALKYFEQALVILKNIGNRRGEGVVLNNIGFVNILIGQFQKAYMAFQENTMLHAELGTHEGLWRSQLGLATTQVMLNDIESALVHFEQALNTIEQIRAGLREKEHKLSFMQAKSEVYDGLISLLQNLHKKHPDKGYDRKTLEIFERKQGRMFLEEMGQSGARLFAGLPEAIAQKELDLELQLKQNRKQLIDERAKIVTEQNKELIQNLEEREKTLKAEQDALQEQIKTKYPDYYALKYPKPASLTELQKKVFQPSELMLVYNVMEEQTVVWLIDPDTMHLYMLSIGEKELQKNVAELRQVMELEWKWSRGERISPEEDKAPQDEQRKVVRFDTSNEQGTTRTFTQVSHELYLLLIPEEVRPLLTEEHILNIVPTGPLYALPFEALVTSPPVPLPEGEGSKTDEIASPGLAMTAHYLIEDIPISYLSSASLLKTLREAQARRKATSPYPLLAFAHPVYESTPASSFDSTQDRFQEENRGMSLDALRSQAYQELFRRDFKELPETAEEARAIKTLLNAPDETAPLQLREKASRENVFALNTAERLDEYQYVVFATHGVLPGEVDYLKQSALVLSHPEKNGYLTMADVFQLQLNAKLVSLSACNTGSGEQVRGEGIMGLTRAFMYAGTPAIAVTLWSVESFSAKALDVGLFEHLNAGQSPIHALRSIKLQMLRGEKGEEYTHPYYWAPFVLFGDGK